MSEAELTRAFTALHQDLISADGPRISTMRSYRFAILQYDPALEFSLRKKTQALTHDLRQAGWDVLPISLQKLLNDRIRKHGAGFISKIIAMEKAKARRSPDDGLDYLKTKLEPLFEGVDGLAADIEAVIARYVGAYPERADKTLALIGRVGALYPFIRASSLLRYLDGRTHNVPVVILYPGLRDPASPSALSFMGVLPADSDYRPRIYP